MKLISIILTFSMIALIACQEPSQTTQEVSFDNSEIVGQWLLVHAQRNGKPTESLKDAYFRFDSVGKVATNVFGLETIQEIFWKDRIAMVSDSSMHYNVKALKVDTLSLTFDIQRYTFDLTMVRAPKNDSLSFFAP